MVVPLLKLMAPTGSAVSEDQTQQQISAEHREQLFL
jgi:hypothetical protein